jgi:hypothetical protein
MNNKLKPFDLERALAGDPVVTREWKKVLTIAHFPHNHPRNHVYAQIEGSFACDTFYSNGRNEIDIETEWDLFMAPKTKKLWIAVNKTTNSNGNHWCLSTIELSKEDLIKSLIGMPLGNYHLVEIEIEE